MDTGGMFGEILEQGKNTAQNAQKGVVQGAVQTAKTAANQVTGSGQPPAQGSNEAALAAQQQKMSDDQAKQFLKDLYGPTKPQSPVNDPIAPSDAGSADANQGPLKQIVGIGPKDPNAGKTPQEIQEIQKLTNELHGRYYQELVNPDKPEEETVVEKLEREEKEKEFKEIEEQKEKPDPLATQKTGTAEKMVGVSG